MVLWLYSLLWRPISDNVLRPENLCLCSLMVRLTSGALLQPETMWLDHLLGRLASWGMSQVQCCLVKLWRLIKALLRYKSLWLCCLLRRLVNRPRWSCPGGGTLRLLWTQRQWWKLGWLIYGWLLRRVCNMGHLYHVTNHNIMNFQS